jgi:hypothetical protein
MGVNVLTCHLPAANDWPLANVYHQSLEQNHCTMSYMSYKLSMT